MYGLGAYNMKGGVAAAVCAVGALARSGARLRGDVIVAAVAGESETAPVRGLTRSFEGPRYRGGGVGSRYYLTHGPVPNLAVVCEPSNLFLTNCESGFLFVKIVLKSREGSTAESSGRQVDALNAMTYIVQTIQAWAPDYAQRHRFNTGLGTFEPGVNVGAVESGWPFKPTYSPPIAHVYITLRLTPAMRPTEPLDELTEVIEQCRRKVGPFEYRLEVYASNFPSTVTPANSKLVQIALGVRERVLGNRQTVCPSHLYGRWDDSVMFRQHGIPAVRLGPSWAHDDPARDRFDRGQHVSIEQLHAAARIYAQIGLELCSLSRAAALRDEG